MKRLADDDNNLLPAILSESDGPAIDSIAGCNGKQLHQSDRPSLLVVLKARITSTDEEPD